MEININVRVNLTMDELMNLIDSFDYYKTEKNLSKDSVDLSTLFDNEDLSGEGKEDDVQPQKTDDEDDAYFKSYMNILDKVGDNIAQHENKSDDEDWLIDPANFIPDEDVDDEADEDIDEAIDLDKYLDKKESENDKPKFSNKEVKDIYDTLKNSAGYYTSDTSLKDKMKDEDYAKVYNEAINRINNLLSSDIDSDRLNKGKAKADRDIADFLKKKH